MYCFQCQEAAKNIACTLKGVCGKTPRTADLQDVLIRMNQDFAVALVTEGQAIDTTIGNWITHSLFMTITNANFDDTALVKRIQQTAAIFGHPAQSMTEEELLSLAPQASILVDGNEDVRSLRQLALIGLKGLCAYLHHAAMLEVHDLEQYKNLVHLLAKTRLEDEPDALTQLVLDVGSAGVQGMALLDRANTQTYGHPEPTTVNLGVRQNPGILVSGHDLRDLEELLIQTQGTGIDVYTHSEMLPAHYYPKLKKYTNLVGNYGSSWWKQDQEFESFNGPILMTTNCLVPPKDSYKHRVFTTGAAGYPGCHHIAERTKEGTKDFGEIIALAKTCPPPTSLEEGSLTGGFAHETLRQFAPQIVDALKAKAIRKFVVMAGCDGRMKSRSYYTDFAHGLAQDTVILTAGCAKYRYNKLKLGSIGDFPRVLDAGQCNDSYSLALTALRLKEALGLADINDLPIVYNIAWYEQKAVIVLLALLSLGVKNIHLGPSLPAFLSPKVAKVLVEKFGIGKITSVEHDLAKLMA